MEIIMLIRFLPMMTSHCVGIFFRIIKRDNDVITYCRSPIGDVPADGEASP
jgi:hypothetical protein